MQDRNNSPCSIHVSTTTTEFLFLESHISEVNTPKLSPVGECLMPAALENWLVVFEVSYKIFLNLEEARKSSGLDLQQISIASTKDKVTRRQRCPYSSWRSLIGTPSTTFFSKDSLMHRSNDFWSQDGLRCSLEALWTLILLHSLGSRQLRSYSDHQAWLPVDNSSPSRLVRHLS